MSDKLEGAPETIWLETDLTTAWLPAWDDGLWSIRRFDLNDTRQAYTLKATSDKRIAELEKVIDEAEIMASKFELAMKDLTDFGGYTYDDDFRREIKAISTFRTLKGDTP